MKTLVLIGSFVSRPDPLERNLFFGWFCWMLYWYHLSEKGKSYDVSTCSFMNRMYWVRLSLIQFSTEIFQNWIVLFLKYLYSMLWIDSTIIHIMWWKIPNVPKNSDSEIKLHFVGVSASQYLLGLSLTVWHLYHCRIRKIFIIRCFKNSKSTTEK